MTVELRLYVTKDSSFSRAALDQLALIQKNRKDLELHLEVIDVVESPTMAEADEITATPTLLKFSPPPLLRIVGDLSSLLEKLGLEEPQLEPSTEILLRADQMSRSAFGFRGIKK